jgi:hypothetical protein
MSPYWNALPEPLQLLIAREALQRAVDTVAGQAEALAEEMEVGSLADLGGVEALRLLACLVRRCAQDPLLEVAGTA